MHYSIPFDRNGNLCEWVGFDIDSPKYEWRPKDYTENGTYKFSGPRKGRSSVRLYFRHTVDNHEISFGINGFAELLRNVNFERGTFTAKIGFLKKGQNYIAKYIGPATQICKTSS